MKFAIVNNVKSEAKKGIIGTCPICSSELIAKCGDFKIHHWAHKRNRNCDSWWEAETEWHRSWKDNYPNDWQEISMIDEKTGEKHIADIRTFHDLVIEFQHSPIDPKERLLREKFYKNMIWVVDGTRLKRDYSRFSKAINDFLSTSKKEVFFVEYSEEVFPVKWLNSTVPVIFDFKGLEIINDKYDKRNKLYCLFQIKQGRYSVLAEITRKAFIKTTINGEWSIRIQNFIESLKPKEVPMPQHQSKVQTIQREGTHYYDPKKGSWVKKRRI